LEGILAQTQISPSQPSGKATEHRIKLLKEFLCARLARLRRDAGGRAARGISGRTAGFRASNAAHILSNSSSSFLGASSTQDAILGAHLAPPVQTAHVGSPIHNPLARVNTDFRRPREGSRGNYR
jgi:hypothetical protein